jgi:hypothetical protein
MAEIVELDPQGDTILILHNANAPFAVWDKYAEWESPLVTTPALQFYPNLYEDTFRRIDSTKFGDKFVDDEDEYPPPKAVYGEEVAVEESPDEVAEPDSMEPPAVSPPMIQGEYSPTASSPTWRSLTPIKHHQGQRQLQMRLSSSHLRLASNYFKRMWNGPWKENSTGPDHCSVEAEDWDPAALLIVMNIIHGHNRSVPRTVSLEMLAKVAMLVDYYECHERVELFSAIWIENLRHQLPKTYDRDLVLWLLVSWVFSQANIFKLISKIALMECRGPLQTLNLPIPATVVGKAFQIQTSYVPFQLSNVAGMIDQKRQESVNNVITLLHNLLTYFRDTRDVCSFECSSILLGALTKGMRALHLFNKPPPISYSFAAIVRHTRNMRSPEWSSVRMDRCRGYHERHSCHISSYINPVLDDLEAALRGLTLKDFCPDRS